MSLPFNPPFLFSRATTVDGYSEIETILKSKLMFGRAVFNALESVVEEYSDWDSDQGFGSSDTTYAIQSFLDYLIREAGLSGQFQTKFTPRLSVVKL